MASIGTVQEWLIKSYAVISTGCTVSTREAVVMGLPVICVMPDNYFFLDHMAWSNYPLDPVCSSEEIKRQFDLIDEMMREDRDMFK